MDIEEITNGEICDLLINRGLTVEKVIDAIVDLNGIIGVGLISLGETLKIYTIHNKELRKRDLTREEVEAIVNGRINKQANGN